MKETQRTITAWADETFGVPASNLSIATRAAKELDELIEYLVENDQHPKAVEECADIVIVLSRLVERRGGDLLADVDRKMAINRTRTWVLSGDGNGQHVKLSHASDCDYWSGEACSREPGCSVPPGVDAQPRPSTGDAEVWPLVLVDIEARQAFGMEKYGVPLRTNDGRKSLVDAYQEALDLVVYLRKEIEERKA